MMESTLNLTDHWAGYAVVFVFAVAYATVLSEEFTNLRKSKPVLLAAGVIWTLLALVYAQNGLSEPVKTAIRGSLVEFAELLLFLLTAMTYVNAMTERNVFAALRSTLTQRRLSYKKLFWATGTIAFLLSPVIDNLTTSLVLAAVVMALGAERPAFIGIACVNIVVAANAGGAFSPFGDITTLMVWQKGQLAFQEFFSLVLPAAVNFLVPALFLQFAVPSGMPGESASSPRMKRGARRIMALFVITLALTVGLHNFLHIPPFVGMMTGLALLQFFGYYLKRSDPAGSQEEIGDLPAYDVFSYIARAEWDTLLFFYGVIFCVSGLGFIGYLDSVSAALYVGWGPTVANVSVGLMSAIIDNIPMMVAVLQMDPSMSEGQWLLVTLTAGVGGSLLSIGSAAGVALMGQARGYYTFFGHLKWTPVIALGYAASIIAHLWANARLF
ncbi:MAG: sodium:proton antiporter NhaD [Woeseia sp.]